MSVEGLRHKYKEYLEKYSILEDPHTIQVALVVVKPEFRGHGIGRKLFSDLNRYADYVGKTIALTPSSEFGGNKRKLRKFYKSLGFVDNKGRNKKYEYMETMYRSPQTSESIKGLVQAVLKEVWNELH